MTCGAGFFVMEAKGHGRLLLSSYGALMRYEVQPGEIRTIGECPRCLLKLSFLSSPPLSFSAGH